MKPTTSDNAIEDSLFNRFYDLIDTISKLDKTYPTARYLIKSRDNELKRVLAVANYENGYSEYWGYKSHMRSTRIYDVEKRLKNNFLISEPRQNIYNNEYHLFNEDIDEQAFSLLEEYKRTHHLAYSDYRMSIFLYYPGHGVYMHKHPNEDIIGTINLYPEQAAPTIFDNGESPVWKLNRLVSFRPDEVHRAFNDSKDTLRASVNYFLKENHV
jgi:hypothetical protein